MLARMSRWFPCLRHVPGLPQIFDALLLAGTLIFDKRRVLATQEIEKAVLSWPGVSTKIHRFGGTEFTVGRREIGHLHGNGLMDIPFPKAIRDEVVAAGQAQPHHIFPQSGWISFYIRCEEDIPCAIALLHRNYERRQAMEDGDKPTPP